MSKRDRLERKQEAQQPPPGYITIQTKDGPRWLSRAKWIQEERERLDRQIARARRAKAKAAKKARKLNRRG